MIFSHTPHPPIQSCSSTRAVLLGRTPQFAAPVDPHLQCPESQVSFPILCRTLVLDHVKHASKVQDARIGSLQAPAQAPARKWQKGRAELPMLPRIDDLQSTETVATWSRNQLPSQASFSELTGEHDWAQTTDGGEQGLLKETSKKRNVPRQITNVFGNWHDCDFKRLSTVRGGSQLGCIHLPRPPSSSPP